MTMRPCIRCGQDFAARDGRQSICSADCRRRNRAAATQRWRDRNPGAEANYSRSYNQRPEVKERNRIASRLRHHQRRDAGVLESTLIPNRSYQFFHDRQGGVCAICKRPETHHDPSGRTKRLAVDHDHQTGLVRGLLCHGCNAALGLMADDPARLEEAARYIKRAVRKHESWQRKVEAVATLAEAMA